MTVVDDNGRKMNVLDVIFRAAVPVLFLLFGWFANTVIGHKERIAVIESNRVTKSDLAVERQSWQQADQAIKERLPPQMFYEQVSELVKTVKSIDERLRDIEKK